MQRHHHVPLCFPYLSKVLAQGWTAAIVECWRKWRPYCSSCSWQRTWQLVIIDYRAWKLFTEKPLESWTWMNLLGSTFSAANLFHTLRCAISFPSSFETGRGQHADAASPQSSRRQIHCDPWSLQASSDCDFAVNSLDIKTYLQGFHRLSTSECLELSGSSLRQAKVQSCPQAAWNQHEFADLQLLEGSPAVEWLPQFLLRNWIVAPAVCSLHATSEGPGGQPHKALKKKVASDWWDSSFLPHWHMNVGIGVGSSLFFYMYVMQYVGAK